jgi:hypothetical protein
LFGRIESLLERPPTAPDLLAVVRAEMESRVKEARLDDDDETYLALTSMIRYIDALLPRRVRVVDGVSADVEQIAEVTTVYTKAGIPPDTPVKVLVPIEEGKR